MDVALALAARGHGTTWPNPMVGAVIVHDGRIAGMGYHRRPGEPHAEVHALNDAGSLARGATLYVNLEPCSHHGRTPPCTEAIIAAGVRRVVAAIVDPDPRVQGRGIARLREAGIDVVVGVREAEARQLNEVYLKYKSTGRPFVLLKAAASLDGRIATVTGHSRWISGADARALVHRLRAVMPAVMVGIGTALADDPRLTARTDPPPPRQPLRVVVDSLARLPPHARMLKVPGSTLVAVTKAAPAERLRRLERAGAKVAVLPDQDGRVSLPALMSELSRQGVAGVLLEGGATLNGAMIAQGLVDKVMFFLAPLLIGGRSAPGAIGDPGAQVLEEAPRLSDVTFEPCGADLLVTGYLPAAGWARD
ncbi:MAG: bifunctional diaminohydroxyphosphoribosylaminopyrimidine deaminase/5-amino-6-(5-phosphoribosylamino)uracil reductase RibD [Firmicutes bacterium]|nr:bifunctional diaminohydroxyphosphoribosylaminopyrimidine deaminase/5-amino-6-(5-phosphoribosylamino)uracil reductase RibD [Bacillota bacterium]